MKTHIHDIDVYHQTTAWTCGPSCVMMALNYFGDNIAFTRDTELDLWEKTRTNRGKLAYTTHPRLARDLMKRGYETELWHEYEEGFRFVPRPGMHYWDFHKRMKYYYRFWEEADAAGMKSRIHPYGVEELAQVVREPDTIIIVFSKCTSGGGGPIFHHGLLYGTDGNDVLVACPMEGRRRMSGLKLERLIATPYGKGALLVRKGDGHDGKA